MITKEEIERKKIQVSQERIIGIGLRIHALRQSIKMKLEDVADLIGMTPSDLMLIEKGETTPSLLACYKLAEALQVTIEEILGIHDVADLSNKVHELEKLKYPIEERTYTYMEYAQWPGRWELLYGVPFSMTAPNMLHQRLVSRLVAVLGFHLGSYFGSNNQEVFTAPFEVHLSRDNEKEIVLQPDIIVVEGKYKLHEYGISRAPELIIEVLSPKTALRDRTTKFELYKESGVQEYWIADPVHETIEVYTFMGEEEVSVTHTYAGGILQSEYLMDFQIPLRLLFQ